ncbi:N-acetylmuramoyl-L-alanine amidase [Shimia sp. R9_3]|uniref:N-acetylmuramoyl-L-alanine amidase n=1 Tax=Shimia sp. R9_3 TaxID=2821113 RepID=UPI001ADAC327|nr:N-acetylmuramoyl-L-alanine amidase [Shimia sp. R9_3]
MKLFEASWKPIAAIAVPIAVAVSPAIYKYYTFDRGVDGIIAEQALQILRSDPDFDENSEISDAEKGVRDWAISVIERYSQTEFPEDARKLLREVATPVFQIQAATNRRIERIIVGGEPNVPFEELRKYHLSLGWRDVGAHYFVTTNGEVLEGRSTDLIPAFAKDFNSGALAIGIACSSWTNIENRPAGDCNFTEDQIQSAGSLISHLADQFGLGPNAVKLRSQLREMTPLVDPIFHKLVPK